MIHPSNVGWQVEKRLEYYEYEHRRTAKKFEYASPAFGEMYGLAAALTYLGGIGLDRIEAQSRALVEQLRAGLTTSGFRIFTPEGTRSPIVSFYVQKEAADARKILENARVQVSLQNGDRTEAYGGTGPGRACGCRCRSSTPQPTWSVCWRLPRTYALPDSRNIPSGHDPRR